jgi:O-antigen/teichoic acid export membrane protein
MFAGEDLRKGRLTRLVCNLRAVSTRLSAAGFQSVSLGIIDQAIVGATGFATSVIVGRWGSKEELGSYYLMLSVLLVARGIQEKATSMPYVVYWSRRTQEERATFAGSCLSHQLILAALASVALLCLTVAVTLGAAPRELFYCAAVLIVFGPALLLKEYLRQLSFAHMSMAAAVQLDITVAVLQVAGLLLVAIADRMSAASAYVTIGLACVMASIAWFAGNHIPFRFAWSEISKDWKWNWRFGKWAVAGQVTGSIVPTVIPWLLGYFHGLGETGLLAAGFALVGPCNVLVIGVTNVLTPRAVEAFLQGGERALWTILRNTSVALVIVLALFFALSLLAGKFIIVVVFGPEFAGAGIVMATLALALLMNSLAMIAASGLYAVELIRINFVIDLVSTLLALCAVGFLVVPLGAFGAAATGVVAATVAATGKCLVVIRLIRSGSTTARSS